MDITDHTLFKDSRLNAWLSWALTLALVLIGIESFLDGDLLWTGFTGAVALIAIIPSIAHRDPEIMLPWEVLTIASVPILARALGTSILANNITSIFSIAAVALIIAVEIQLLTEVKMTHNFAILFVVITTWAAAGLWAVARWLANIHLGTTFYLHHDIVMWEFVASTATGLLAGIIFDWYFRRNKSVIRRFGRRMRR